jgi:hypothetical protein
MEKKFDAVKIVREIRNKMYEEWKKDPISFDKKIMGSVEHLNRKYGTKSKHKKAA